MPWSTPNHTLPSGPPPTASIAERAGVNTVTSPYPAAPATSAGIKQTGTTAHATAAANPARTLIRSTSLYQHEPISSLATRDQNVLTDAPPKSAARPAGPTPRFSFRNPPCFTVAPQPEPRPQRPRLPALGHAPHGFP